MISKFAQHITKILYGKNYIKEDDCEVFEYGIFLVLSQVLYFTVCLLFGIFYGCVLESVIFYFSFMVVREYAGGYHASTELRCFLFSTISIFLSVNFIKVLESQNTNTAFVIVLSLATLLIILLSPLDTPEKPLTANEFKKFRKKTLIILSVLLLACIIAFIKFDFISYSVGVAIILEGLMLLLGKLKKLWLNFVPKR